MNEKGKFVISLDFELFWGVRDVETFQSYGEHILGVWEALPKMLDLFEKYDIRATFATVGFLFASDKRELETFFPSPKPTYLNAKLSPYAGHLDLVKDNEEVDKYHFATSLLELIKKYPNQEIATHTFSHYYCLEEGQTVNDFKSDMLAASAIAEAKDIKLKSLVFPRHQFNENYLEVCRSLGVDSYRGNEDSWFYKASTQKEESLIKRAFRFLDVYLNISGFNCYSIAEIAKNKPYNIPSSRFLRPYSPKLKSFEKLRLNRILKSMDYAASNGKVFHLWWHPHNFGIHQDQNFNFLEKILNHYQQLNRKFQFESRSMSQLSEEIKLNNE